MSLEFLRERWRESGDADAIVWRDRAFSYNWLRERWDHCRLQLAELELPAGAVVILEADFSPNAVAWFLALVEAQCILVPMTGSLSLQRDELIEIAEGEYLLRIDADDNLTFARLERTASHGHYRTLRDRQHPGLVLFSSGSTGRSKGAVHDLAPLLEKFRTPRRALRTISFLLYDHIGGLNTMLHTLSNGGCLVTVAQRSPDAVLQAIDKHRVQLLPTTPTFLNLILIGEAHRRHALDSLELVTYGTEPMPESTLRRFHELFPRVLLQQTYGLSEVGILRSKSKSSDSLWVRIGGEGYDLRVVDGILQIRAQAAMLGYLNAPSPFTDDGWFHTGDRVEVDGDFMRFLGRDSEIINVGGEKVYPAEVESVIQELDNVAQASVYGEKHPITGQIVCVRVTLVSPEERVPFTTRLKQHCARHLQPYKIPVRVVLSADAQHSDRFKKIRRA